MAQWKIQREWSDHCGKYRYYVYERCIFWSLCHGYDEHEDAVEFVRIMSKTRRPKVDRVWYYNKYGEEDHASNR